MVRFGISTAWNARHAPDAECMIDQILDIGFTRIELNFTLTHRDVCDIISMRQRKGIVITSLHNYCPIPEGVDPKDASPDYYSLSSIDMEERGKAIDATKTTIETARDLDAKAVVLHLGKVEIKDRTRELAATLDDKANYKRVKERMVEERSQKARPYFEMASLSLSELLPVAKAHDIKLGIENRYYYNEIPSIDEMQILLDHFKDDSIGYWHDTGHAQIFQNIGMFDHRDYLERYASRMIGVHLHDITGPHDHRAPLQGTFDFSVLKPYIKKETLLILEPHYPATPKEITKGAKYLAKLFGV